MENINKLNAVARHPMSKAAKKEKATSITLKTLMYLVLIIAALIVLIPLAVVFVASFKNNGQIGSTFPLAFPSWDQMQWGNYFGYVMNADGTYTPSAWEYLSFSGIKENMGEAFLYTFAITGVSLVITILVGCFVAYVLSRFDFWGKKIVKFLFLLASIVPSVTMQISIFQLITNIGLFDTPYAIILLYSGTDIISIYILLQFLDNIPKEVDEAALVDGCNYFQIFWRIIMPLMRPAIATVCIIKGISYYNDYYVPSLYWPSKKTVSTFLQAMNGANNTDWGVVCAGVVIAIIPTIVIFLILQDQIYSGLTSGAVKS
jgi:multiple sugar transport system permease protein